MFAYDPKANLAVLQNEEVGTQVLCSFVIELSEWREGKAGVNENWDF